MSNTETLFAANTQRILDEGIECGNDFVSLAISGEYLRGYAAMNDISSPELAAYDEFLSTYKGETHDGLEETMAEIMVELVNYSRESRITRDLEKGTGLIADITETLAVAAAMTRAGRWDVARLKDLCERTHQVVDSLVPSLLDLSAYADDHTLIYMSDSEWCEHDISDVYSFLEPLAQFSLGRLELEVTVIQWARRKRMIADAIAAFERSHE